MMCNTWPAMQGSAVARVVSKDWWSPVKFIFSYIFLSFFLPLSLSDVFFFFLILLFLFVFVFLFSSLISSFFKFLFPFSAFSFLFSSWWLVWTQHPGLEHKCQVWVELVRGISTGGVCGGRGVATPTWTERMGRGVYGRQGGGRVVSRVIASSVFSESYGISSGVVILRCCPSCSFSSFPFSFSPTFSSPYIADSFFFCELPSANPVCIPGLFWFFSPVREWFILRVFYPHPLRCMVSACSFWKPLFFGAGGWGKDG